MNTWLNKGPGAYCFERVQTPGAYLNQALIESLFISKPVKPRNYQGFFASTDKHDKGHLVIMQTLRFTQGAPRHHANVKVYTRGTLSSCKR